MKTGRQPRRARLHGLTAVIATALLAIGCEQKSDSSAASTSSSASPSSTSSSTSSSPAGASAVRSGTSGKQAAQATAVASAVDQQYAAILSAVVSENGLVRYSALAQEPLKGQLDAVVAGYAAEKLPSESEVKARMALWCNAYNANMLKIALTESRKEGFTTLKDAPDGFEQREIAVAGESMTIKELQDRLRAMNDPRIHAALVFGARSCPPLRSEPYAADRLDEQLDHQSFAWLDDFGKHRVARDAMMLSPIFEWHAADFEVDPYGGPVGFVRKHGRPNGLLRQFARKVAQPTVRYVNFNWALNDAGEGEEDTVEP